jgi:hypothetical protein
MAQMHREQATKRYEELWRVRKGDRELFCIAVYLPAGIDLRLLEGVDFRRTQLCRTAPDVQALAEDWKTKLIAAGWVNPQSVGSH